jgi:hypothetical protein
MSAIAYATALLAMRALCTTYADSVRHRNATVVGFNVTTATYSDVFVEISKYNVQLNLAERLWAVCAIQSGTKTPGRNLI